MKITRNKMNALQSLVTLGFSILNMEDGIDEMSADILAKEVEKQGAEDAKQVAVDQFNADLDVIKSTL
jgi:hypothetical protein